MFFDSLRRRLPRGFGLHLTLWFATVVAFVSIVVFLVAYYLLSATINLEDRALIRARLDVYRNAYERGGIIGLSSEFDEESVVGGDDSFVVHVFGPAHSGLFLHVPHGKGIPSMSDMESVDTASPLKWLNLPAANSASSWLIATMRLGTGQWLQVGKTTDARAAVLEHFRVVFFWVLALALALGILAGVIVTRRTLVPIRQLIGAFQRVIATGRMDERIALRRSEDEIGQLTRLFNRMLEKNDALIRGMREALDNVAHDLRTPLTRLRNTAERALHGVADETVCREALSDALEESDRVGTVLTTLMDISEAETGIMRLEKAQLNVLQVVNAAVELYALVADDKEIEVCVDVADAVQCTADRSRLQQVLVNLIDNAIKYSPRGRTVRVHASEAAAGTTICVSDEGVGISPEEIPHIWERLYRGDKSRAERGLGLGLSLVRAIVQAHGGRVSVDSTVGTGSTFRVWLPAPYSTDRVRRMHIDANGSEELTPRGSNDEYCR